MKKIIFLALFLLFSINLFTINAETITSTSYSVDTTQIVITGGSLSSNSYDATPSISGQGNIVSSSYTGISGYSVYCNESWSCSSWSICSSSSQTRICTDNNYCGTINHRPILSQSCDSGSGDTGSGSGGGGGGGGGGAATSKKNSTIVNTNQKNPNPTIENPIQSTDNNLDTTKETDTGDKKDKNPSASKQNIPIYLIAMIIGILLLIAIVVAVYFIKKKNTRKR